MGKRDDEFRPRPEGVWIMNSQKRGRYIPECIFFTLKYLIHCWQLIIRDVPTISDPVYGNPNEL